MCETNIDGTWMSEYTLWRASKVWFAAFSSGGACKLVHIWQVPIVHSTYQRLETNSLTPIQEQRYSYYCNRLNMSASLIVIQRRTGQRQLILWQPRPQRLYKYTICIGYLNSLDEWNPTHEWFNRTNLYFQFSNTNNCFLLSNKLWQRLLYLSVPHHQRSSEQLLHFFARPLGCM